jgi:hypothetical protein
MSYLLREKLIIQETSQMVHVMRILINKLGGNLTADTIEEIRSIVISSACVFGLLVIVGLAAAQS